MNWLFVFLGSFCTFVWSSSHKVSFADCVFSSLCVNILLTAAIYLFVIATHLGSESEQ